MESLKQQAEKYGWEIIRLDGLHTISCSKQDGSFLDLERFVHRTVPSSIPLSMAMTGKTLRYSFYDHG